MAEAQTEPAETGAKRFVAPMILCLVLGILFTVTMIGLNISHEEPKADAQNPIYPLAPAAPVASAEPPRGATAASGDDQSTPAAETPRKTAFASQGAQTAEIGGYLAYRGLSALTLTVAASGIAAALIALALFVRGARTRRIVWAVLVGELGIAAILPLMGRGATANVVWRMTCHSGEQTASSWDFCASHGGPGATIFAGHYHFSDFGNAFCSAATCAIVFAIFIVARSDERSELPAVVGSREKAVTVLMVAASVLLVAVVLRERSYLDWAFADYLALTDPPGDILAYIEGTSTFFGAVATALLALAWFVALVLLQMPRDNADGEPAPATGGSASFSVYNLPAIFAPVLSALASNFLGGG